jgi:hypothetical protein
MKTFLTIMLLSSVSCSQFLTGRSYLSEMEHNDGRFFNPREDFPVVAGDNGRDWETTEERNERTPTSETDLAAERSRRRLKQELRELENQQSDQALEEYDKHKRSLATTSEKIYFLKLSSHERKEYLNSRGFMRNERAPASFDQQMYGVRDANISQGMTKADVEMSWGRPSRVEVAGNPSYENERWLYTVHGASKYIYFESGVVNGWE